MKSLRLRLTWLYALTSGLILTLAMAGFLLLRIKETRQAQLDDFYSVWNSLSLRLQSDSLISHGFLAQTETANQVLIHIEENGVPLLYPGSWTPLTERQILIKRAKKQAEEQGISLSTAPVSSSASATALMTITGDQNEQYYAMYQTLAQKKGMRNLCVISYRTPVRKSLKKTILTLWTLDLAGILCLSFVSWHFVGWSLRPVEEGRRKQAEFIAAASHELRSPLAVLRSGVSAMPCASEEQENLLRIIDSECSRMSRLIDDLLFLASADSKTWKIRPEKIDMDTLLIETYESFLPLCREKNTTLYLELPPSSLPVVIADPQRIRQILSILLDNALTHSPSHGEIRICAKAAKILPHNPGSVILQVRDHGCGIPDHIKPHVFDRFYRADRARSDKSHFGLGLSIAKELISLHRGSIVLTDNPGGGSCFTVTLPVQADN